jgi:Ner family transcriptional regulator
MLAKYPPKNPDLRRVWIMASLRAIGSSYAAIARELGVTRQTVMIAAKFPAKSARCCAAIAAKLGLHPSDVWPERYRNDRDSTSRRRVGQ